MSAKYHISTNGNIEICRAKVRPCPLGGGHFDSVKDAEEYLEQKYSAIEEYETNVMYGVKYKSIDANQRGLFVERETKQALDDGKSSYDQYYDVKKEEWSKERQVIHEELINQMLKQYESVPNDKQIVMSAGLPGAGKTTVLTRYENLNMEDWATISSDDFKEMLAANGHVPEIEGLTPMEASTLVHEESSYLADKLLEKLSSQGKNLIYDFTCKNEEKTKMRLSGLIDKGYETKNMQFVFVDIPVETAKERAKFRYVQGLNEGIENDHKNKELEFEGKLDEQRLTLGGRYLPEEVIDKSRPKGRIHSSINAEVLITLHEDRELNLPTPKIYNNAGSAPVKKEYTDFLIGN